MRIWDLSPEKMCRNHLLGEHRELHALWSILVKKKRGFRNHPETLRWRGKLKALYQRHKLLAQEMKKRGYQHKSVLDKREACGQAHQNDYVDSLSKQKEILKKKKCGCLIN